MQDAKPCVIIHKNGSPMKYDPISQTVAIAPDFTVFPSRHAALSAHHHAVENDRKNFPEPWNEYRVAFLNEGKSQ